MGFLNITVIIITTVIAKYLVGIQWIEIMERMAQCLHV